MPFADERYEDEIKEYLTDMIDTITTGDDKYDLDQIKLYSSIIAAQQGCEPAEIHQNLLVLRKEFF